jgi:tetratricopeptide (TPR) repeat protein
MRLIAKAYKAKADNEAAFSYYMQACAEAPNEREGWVELSRYCYEQQDWPMSYGAAKRALLIETRPMSYICEPAAWGALPWDLLSVAAWNIGHKDEALHAAIKAMRLEPTNARLAANVELLSKK